MLKRCCVFLFALIGLLGRTALASDEAYKRVQLPHGISIEIPAHWTVLSDDARKNNAAGGQAMLDNAVIESEPGRKKTLLAVNAVPSPIGAMIRLSVTSPPSFSQSDLLAAKPNDLKEIEQEMLNMARKMEASGGPKIFKMQAVQIEPFNKSRALVTRYDRLSVNGPSPWRVTQYKIPLDSRLIELTLSSRQSDSVVWNPILERVKRSIKF